MIGAVGGAVLSLTADEVFESRAEFLKQASSVTGSPFLQGSSNTDRDLENEVELMESGGTAEEIEARTGRRISVSAAAGADSDVINVSHQASSSATAQTNLADWTEAYVAFRREAEQSALRDAAERAEEAAEALRVEIETIEQPLIAKEAELLAATDDLARLALQQEVDELRQSVGPEVAQLESQLDQLESEVLRLRADAETIEGSLQIITPASRPSDPESANVPGAVLIGSVVGFLAGLAIAVARNQLDDSVRSTSDLQHAVGGVPVLGSVPRYERQPAPGRPVLVDDPRAPAAESYRSLATSLGFLGFEHRTEALLVTSPVAGDGKTSTVANLGVAMARTGQRVILLDADMRRPALAEQFGLSATGGAIHESLIEGADPLESDQSTMVDGLSVIAARTTEENPADLLQSDVARHVIRRLSDHCDVLLIDCPPVLPVADALILGHHVDRAVLVTNAGQTSRDQIHAAVDRLAGAGTEVSGVVLNSVTVDESYAYYRRTAADAG